MSWKTPKLNLWAYGADHHIRLPPPAPPPPPPLLPPPSSSFLLIVIILCADPPLLWNKLNFAMSPPRSRWSSAASHRSDRAPAKPKATEPAGRSATQSWLEAQGNNEGSEQLLQ